jgi:hypothetical protein
VTTPTTCRSISPRPFRGAQAVTLNTPGLYVFVCKLHPFILAAVMVDDPNTEGLDLGDQIRLVNGFTVSMLSDLGECPQVGVRRMRYGTGAPPHREFFSSDRRKISLFTGIDRGST